MAQNFSKLFYKEHFPIWSKSLKRYVTSRHRWFDHCDDDSLKKVNDKDPGVTNKNVKTQKEQHNFCL